MSETQYAQFQELLRLIAQYDWATEGAQPPADNTLSRQGAADLRNRLVRVATQVTATEVTA